MKYQYLPLKCIKSGFSLIENIISASIFIVFSLAIISTFIGYIKMSEESNRLQVSQLLVGNVCDQISRNELSLSASTTQYKPSEIKGTEELFKSNQFKIYDKKLVLSVDKSDYTVGSGSNLASLKLYKVYVYEKLDNNNKKLLFQNNVIVK